GEVGEPGLQPGGGRPGSPSPLGGVIDADGVQEPPGDLLAAGLDRLDGTRPGSGGTGSRSFPRSAGGGSGPGRPGSRPGGGGGEGRPRWWRPGPATRRRAGTAAWG